MKQLLFFACAACCIVDIDKIQADTGLNEEICSMQLSSLESRLCSFDLPVVMDSQCR